MAGQTINDRLLAARHSIAGQGLAKSVCKATTEEMIGPKKKHLDYLVQCTNEPNVSIPQLANLLVERSQNANWIVVYKALITVHHMMCYGNERFTQYLASSNSTFQLSTFLDKSGLQGITTAKVGYDMSPFIRRYARYLNEKAISYRTVAFDFCKVKRGKEDGTLRTMNAEKLLKTLPTLQNQLDALLEFDCAATNLTNGVINMCFMLLFRDLIRLFACYNDGVINLLEKYFDMNKKQCREALDLYKKFLIRMDRVAEFLKVAENVGIDKGEIPDLTKAPSSLLDALEQHLAAVEGKKSNTTSPTQSANNARDVKFGMTALSSTSSAFGTAAINGRLDNGIDESLKQQVLAEEEAAMNQYKSKLQSPNNATNPFLSTMLTNNNAASPVISTVDLFAPAPVPAPIKHDGMKASDDLLQLNNPFADVFSQQPTVPTVNHTQHQSMWMTNGNGYTTQTPVAGPTTTAFVSESNFSSVFGATESTAANDLSVSGSPALNPFLTDYTSEIPSVFQFEPAAEITTDYSQLQQETAIIYQVQNDLSDIHQVSNTSVVYTENIAQIPENTIINSDIPDNNTIKIDDISSETLYGNDEIRENIKIQQIELEDVQNSIINNKTQDLMLDLDVSKVTLDKQSDNIIKTERKNSKSTPPPRPPRPPLPVIKQQTNKVVTNSEVPVETGLNQSMLMTLGSPTEIMPLSAAGNQILPQNNPISQNIPNIPIAAPHLARPPSGQGFDALGSVLQPANRNQGLNNAANNTKNNQQSQGSALLTGDLESSLASLAENLSINKGPPPVKGVQWNSPKNGAKTGSNWTPQPMAATTGAGYRPMGQGMTTLPTQPMFPSMQPMGIRPMMSGSAMVTPLTAISASQPTANQPMTPQQSLLFH